MVAHVATTATGGTIKIRMVSTFPPSNAVIVVSQCKKGNKLAVESEKHGLEISAL